MDEIVRHLDGYAVNQTWIIQDRIRPHPDLAAVVPDVCPTLRIMTLNQGEIRVTGAILRFGDGDVPADNAGAGGIAFFVDESGKLGRGVHSVNGRSVFRTAHPRTAVQVSGANVPFWTQALELAMESARKLPQLTYLGWDIAITADGPLVLETNSASGVLSLQKLNDRGLLAGPMRAVIDPFQGITRSGIALYAANERCGIDTPWRPSGTARRAGRGEVRHQKIDERAQLGGLVTACGVHRVEIRRGQRVVGQDGL